GANPDRNLLRLATSPLDDLPRRATLETSPLHTRAARLILVEPFCFRCWMAVRLLSVRVAPAAFGDGVYACRSFRRGQRVGRVYGEVVGGDEGSEYAIDLGDDRLLEPGAPFRFLNHSCEPNCELINYTPDDAAPHEYEVYVCAMRKI